MATLHSWMFLMLIAAMTSCAYATSLAHSVFLPSDKSSNPFSDRFVQKVAHLDRKKLNAIAEMNGNDLLLLELMQNDNALYSPTTRQSKPDPYESILDDKLDDQLTLQDNIDGEWVHLMTSGPLSVIFMGNLLTVASKRDFPLTRPAQFVFQHIKEPNSFRATLAQVSGSMYSALLSAHTAMDRIQFNVQQVPDEVKTILQIALAGSSTLIKVMLPKTLESISQVANASAVEARMTFRKFSSLQELLAEIIEASAYTHSAHETVLNEIKSEINQSKLEEEELNKNIAIIKAHYEDARREMERARKEYQDARNAVPTARRRIKRFLGGLFRAIASFISAPLRILGCILGFCHSDRAAYETAKRNAIEKANLLLGVLQEAEKRYNVFVEQQAAEQQKLMDIVRQIATLDLERMDEQEIVDILIDSLRQMSQIKKQWSRLIQFFSKLSLQADSTQEIVIHELIGIIKEGQANNLFLDPTDREFFVEILSDVCQEIERGAHLLYVMSKTYYDISSEYMINQITGVHTLLLLQTDKERSFHLNALSADVNSTAAKIMQLAQERQNEYTARNRARRAEFERFLAETAKEDLNNSK